MESATKPPRGTPPQHAKRSTTEAGWAMSPPITNEKSQKGTQPEAMEFLPENRGDRPQPESLLRIDEGGIYFKPFRSHPLFLGGHLQTLATQFVGGPRKDADTPENLVAKTDTITLLDGDQIVIHENSHSEWSVGDPSILIVHGLGGNHRTGYMLRLTKRFTARGIRVFRVDMRGCGLGFDVATGLNHAGRSSDVLAALSHAARLTQEGPIGLIGVSLGGAQSLKMLAELDNGSTEARFVQSRLQRAAIVAPPIDLAACSRNMERLGMRPYNRFFIRHLLGNVPTRVANSPRWQALDHGKLPKTMFELDERFTAPFSGFAGALDYYEQSAALRQLPRIQTPTLILAAKDDPIIPIKTILTADWPRCVRIECIAGGGHVGFFQRGPQKYWMDERLDQWFSAAPYATR